MVNCINLIIEMSPRFVPGRENVPCVAEVVDRSLKADCTDFKYPLQKSQRYYYLWRCDKITVQKNIDYFESILHESHNFVR